MIARIVSKWWYPQERLSVFLSTQALFHHICSQLWAYFIEVKWTESIRLLVLVSLPTMSLNDQKLRQELIGFGETVPPITARNRDQWQSRLEVLRAQPRPRPTSSPSRSRASTSRAPTRSRPVPGLIELSDSDTDAPSGQSYNSRAAVSGSSAQTRSIAVQRYVDANPILDVTSDVERSIARRRREIQQLIDSARERTMAANTSVTSAQQAETTPFRSRPSSNYNRENSNTDLKTRKPKQPSWFARSGKAIQTFWNDHRTQIINTLKALFIGALVGGGLIFLKNKGPDLIPHRKGTSIELQGIDYHCLSLSRHYLFGYECGKTSLFTLSILFDPFAFL